MNKIRSLSWWGTRLGFALLASQATVPVLAAGSGITADVKTIPGVQLNDKEWRAMSMVVGRLLVHIDHARQAMENKEKQEALAQINKGQTLVKIIEKAEPDYSIRATIRAGDNVYQDESRVKPFFVPMYSEPDQISLEGPIITGNREVARDAKLTGAPVIKEVSSFNTQIKFDVLLAKDHLEVAKTALEQGELEQADRALSAIQEDGVIFAFAEEDRPLERAHENLMLVKRMIEEGNPQDARIELQAASDSLAEYSKTGVDEHRASQALVLRDEINVLSNEVGKDLGEVAQRIARCGTSSSNGSESGKRPDFRELNLKMVEKTKEVNHGR